MGYIIYFDKSHHFLSFFTWISGLRGLVSLWQIIDLSLRAVYLYYSRPRLEFSVAKVYKRCHIMVDFCQ